MKLRRSAPSAPGEPVLPLIDVVFFLLVFFLIVGRMDATAPFEVLPPLGTTGADMAGGTTVVSVSADGSIALDGAALADDAFLSALERRVAADPAHPVRINADGRASLRHVMRLMTRLEAFGATDIALVVSPGAQ